MSFIGWLRDTLGHSERAERIDRLTERSNKIIDDSQKANAAVHRAASRWWTDVRQADGVIAPQPRPKRSKHYVGGNGHA